MGRTSISITLIPLTSSFLLFFAAKGYEVETKVEVDKHTSMREHQNDGWWRIGCESGRRRGATLFHKWPCGAKKVKEGLKRSRS